MYMMTMMTMMTITTTMIRMTRDAILSKKKVSIADEIHFIGMVLAVRVSDRVAKGVPAMEG